jgi:hypothetical protein
MDPAIPMMLPLLLGASLMLVVWVIAADRTRYLTRFDLRHWDEQYYLQALPNFLQALHDDNFTWAWPARLNAVSAAYFAYRVRPILRARPSMTHQAFLQQHLNLCAQLHILRPYIADALMAEQARIVMNRIMEMEDTADRDRLLGFVAQVRRYRTAFQESLTPFDRQNLAQMKCRDFIPTLRRIHAVCLEHGFALLPQFDALRRWRELSGSELVQQLPKLPDVRSLRSARAKVFDAAAAHGGV